jgi:hypothetical protein
MGLFVLTLDFPALISTAMSPKALPVVHPSGKTAAWLLPLLEQRKYVVPMRIGQSFPNALHHLSLDI